MTWKAFLLKQHGFNKAKLEQRRWERLLNYNVCVMLKNPKQKFPPINKFIKLEDDSQGAEMTIEERRAIIERNRKFKMK